MIWRNAIVYCFSSWHYWSRQCMASIMASVEWSSLIGLSIAFLYGVCSASMAFANKAVLTSYAFNYPFFLVTCQMAVTIGVLELLRMTGRTTLVRFTFARGLLFLMPSIFYAANCVFSLSALGGMNIPMYGLVKRCIPLAILLLGVLVLGKPMPSTYVCASVATMTVGCIIAGFGDLAFDMHAYLSGAASVLSQAFYLLLVQKHADDIGAAESLHLNSYNTLPMLLVCSAATGELRLAFSGFTHYLAAADAGFVSTFVLVIVFGCLLNYLLFLCTTYNSALTTSVTGTLKSVVQTVIGVFTFGGINVNPFTVTGILLNFVGGGLYTYVKYRENQHHRPCTVIPMTTDKHSNNSIRHSGGSGEENGQIVHSTLVANGSCSSLIPPAENERDG